MTSVSRARFWAAFVLASLQLLIAGSFPSVPQLRAQAAMAAIDVVPGEYIVTLRQAGGFSAASVAAAYDREPGIAVDHVFEHVIDGFSAELSPAAVTELLDDPNVASVTPNYVAEGAAQEVPPGMRRIDGHLNPTVVGDEQGSVDIDVAVLDTGIFPHPDLNFVYGKNCIDTDGRDPYDVNGHGTHVAGIIGAKDDDAGTVGVAPGARVWAVKVLGDDNVGSWAAVICGLDFVVTKPEIRVVNMSLGGSTGNLSPACGADPVHQAVCNVVNSGVPVIVAAMNNSQDAAGYSPAKMDEVITVSAYADYDGEPGGQSPCNSADCDDAIAGFSNYGSVIDIAAPGVSVYSTWTGNQYQTISGTSMATPHVAGAAALILAQQGGMTPAQVRARLLLTAEPGPLTADPDANNEPLLNVAFMNTGKILAPATAGTGDRVLVRLGSFTPNSTVTFSFNGQGFGQSIVADTGRASTPFIFPALPRGSYEISATNGLKTVSRMIDVVPEIRLNKSSGIYRDLASVSFAGFAPGERVVVTFRDGAHTTTLVTVTVSSKGAASPRSFRVPTSTTGGHSVIATGDAGSVDTTTFRTLPTASVNLAEPTAGDRVKVTVHGFKKSERVTVRLDSPSGPALGTFTASTRGSGSVWVTLPVSLDDGPHSLFAVGSRGNMIEISLSIEAAELPTPTASATVAETASPSATPQETQIVDEPTETPTEVILTETPTMEVPSETPSAKIPTETPTVPVATSTLEPTSEAPDDDARLVQG